MRIEVVRDLSQTQAAEWRDFLRRSRHGHPEQDPGFAGGWAAQGHDVLYAMGHDGDAVRAVAMINIEPGPLGVGLRATAMSGPVCDDPADMRAFLDGLTDHPAMRRVGQLTITPYWLAERATALSDAFDGTDWAPFEEAELRRTGIHDATGTPDEIAARFNKSARRKLKKAREFGLEIDYVTDEATALEAFEIHNRHFQDRTGADMDRDAFLSDFRAVYAQGDLGALFLVRHEGVILGGCIVHRSADTVFMRYSFMDDAATARIGNIRLAPLITVEALSWGQARGCRYGDENGYIHGLDPDHPLYRVYKYKEEFRPAEVQRMPGRRKVLRPAAITGADLAERALDRAGSAATALRGVVGGTKVAHGAQPPATADSDSPSARNWVQAVKLPLGLTVGGSAGWLALMLVD